MSKTFPGCRRRQHPRPRRPTRPGLHPTTDDDGEGLPACLAWHSTIWH